MIQLANAINLYQSDCSDYRFDFIVHCDKHFHLAFGDGVLPLGSCRPKIQQTPLHLGFPIHIISDLQRRVTTELFKDVGYHLTNLFLTVVMIGVFSRCT